MRVRDRRPEADVELTIKKDGDKLAGTMSWPDQKDEKLKDVKLKDGTLTFSAVRKFMDNEIPIEYTLTIDGDKLKGKARVGVRGPEAGVRHRGEAGEEGQVGKQGTRTVGRLIGWTELRYPIPRSHHEREEKSLRTPFRPG